MESSLGAPRRRPGAINQKPLWIGRAPQVAGPSDAVYECERVELAEADHGNRSTSERIFERASHDIHPVAFFDRAKTAPGSEYRFANDCKPEGSLGDPRRCVLTDAS